MTVTVNGTVYEVPDGSSVQVSNGSVIIGGSKLTSYKESVKVEVQGSCGDVRTASGDVTVTGGVSGSVQTVSGDVDCGNISGDVTTTSGDVMAQIIKGSVRTLSGDIRGGR